MDTTDDVDDIDDMEAAITSNPALAAYIKRMRDSAKAEMDDFKAKAKADKAEMDDIKTTALAMVQLAVDVLVDGDKYGEALWLLMHAHRMLKIPLPAYVSQIARRLRLDDGFAGRETLRPPPDHALQVPPAGVHAEGTRGRAPALRLRSNPFDAVNGPARDALTFMFKACRVGQFAHTATQIHTF